MPKFLLQLLFLSTKSVELVFAPSIGITTIFRFNLFGHWTHISYDGSSPSIGLSFVMRSSRCYHRILLFEDAASANTFHAFNPTQAQETNLIVRNLTNGRANWIDNFSKFPGSSPGRPWCSVGVLGKLNKKIEHSVHNPQRLGRTAVAATSNRCAGFGNRRCRQFRWDGRAWLHQVGRFDFFGCREFHTFPPSQA